MGLGITAFIFAWILNSVWYSLQPCILWHFHIIAPMIMTSDSPRTNDDVVTTELHLTLTTLYLSQSHSHSPNDITPFPLHSLHSHTLTTHTHTFSHTLFPPSHSFTISPLQFVVIMFWSIYFVDQELVFPREIEKHIPPILNHLWHTVPLMLVFLELLVVFHRYLSNMISVFAVFVMSTAYIVWIVWVFTNAGIWPYPFFKIIPLPVLPLFFTASFVLTIGFYFLGKWCCYLRWKGEEDLCDARVVASTTL